LVPVPRAFSLSRREADIAVTLERPREGRLVARKLTDYRLGLFASRAYLEAHGTPETLEELREHHLVGYVEDLLYAPARLYGRVPQGVVFNPGRIVRHRTDGGGACRSGRRYPAHFHGWSRHEPDSRHPPLCLDDARLDAYYLGNLVGNPIETTIVAAQLVMGGVLERHPGLRVLLAHGGGAIAALAGRLQRGKDTMRPSLRADLADPLVAVRRLYVDTIVHSPEALALILAVLGEDRVLLGSDWPFPMGSPDAAHDIGHLPQALQHRLRAENVHSLFGERLRRDKGEENSCAPHKPS